MGRLTQRNGDGYSLNHDACPMRGRCSDSTDCVEVLLARLAAYEETGYTPEDVETAKEALTFFRRDNAALGTELKNVEKELKQ